MKFSIATFVTDESIAPGPLAAAVEERGFHALMVTEHSHMPVAYEPPYPGAGEPPREYYRTLDPFVALASAAAATRTLTLNQRGHPAGSARRALHGQRGGHPRPGL